MSWMTPRNSLKFHGDFGGPQLPSAPPASAPERSRRHPPAVRTGFGNTRTVLDFGHFANGTWVTDLVSVNRQTTPRSPAPLPFSYGHPSEPSRDLFLRHPWVIGSGRDFDPWPGDLLTGSVRVVSDRPIGEMLRFGHPDLGVAGVGASPPPLSGALFPVRRQEGGITTGVALHNLESSPELLRCELRKEGVLLDAASSPWRPTGKRPGSSTRRSPPPIRPTSWARCVAPHPERGCSAPWP